jgi:ABC-type transport system substrate-binding protein
MMVLSMALLSRDGINDSIYRGSNLGYPYPIFLPNKCWQGLWSENQNFNHEVDCEVDEIRRLLDDDTSSLTEEGL